VELAAHSDLEGTPRVLVLLANRNGERWLPQFLPSLQSQEGVRLRLVVSDNGSTDDSRALLTRFSERCETEILPPAPFFETAGANFFRLVLDADPDDADYVAFADNDDVWEPCKLATAIASIRERELDGYSSFVTPFWEGGKSFVYPQCARMKRYDHYFEGGGAGCTFVLKRQLFDAFRSFLRANPSLGAAYHHDWAIYAFARSNGYRWFIDTRSLIRYRQHSGNETGINSGATAARRRARMVRGGWYHAQISTMLAHFPCPPLQHRVSRLGLLDRVALALQAFQFRRRFRDVLLLVPILLTMRKAQR
jgi:rhamnosyltransferase